MYPDEDERFYGGSPAAECTLCGSFGSLYHFAGEEDICPFCVVKIARKPLYDAAQRVVVEFAREWLTMRGGKEVALRELNDVLTSTAETRPESL